MSPKLKSQKILLKAKVFDVESLEFEGRDPNNEPYTRLVSRDWVNILPITPDKKAVLIRQYRCGALKETLEVPGGNVDDTEKDFMMAALREMEEETGFTSARVLPLGSISANPALMNNKLHMFVALNCQINANRKHFPDATEQIQIELVPVQELEMMVRTGQIDHCLSALTAMLALKYLS